MGTLTGKDLRLTLPVAEDGSPLAALDAALAVLETAARREWPAVSWAWDHGPDCTSKVVAALARRAAAYVPEPDDTHSDHCYCPLGTLATTTGKECLAWAVVVSSFHDRPWLMTVEPRMRTRSFLGTHYRVLGRFELNGQTVTAMDSVLLALAKDAGPRAEFVSTNAGYGGASVLVHPKFD